MQSSTSAKAKSSARNNEESGESVGKPNTMITIAQTGNLEELVQAYLLQKDFTEKDDKGNNLLHIAAQADQRPMCRALIALTVNDCLWDEKNVFGNTPIDVASPKVRKDLQLIAMKTSTASEHHSSLNKALIEEKIKNPNPNHKVMLSMDGGGIKALLEVGILLAIEQELGEPLMSRIHWLGGTSCGGIMSLALGVGIQPLILRRIFLAARERVFCGNTKTFPKHNSEGIEDYLKTVLGANTTMSEIKNRKVIVTAARVSHAPPSLVLFRSFAPRIPSKAYENHGYMNPEKIKVWKAARCTSAAPVYFSSYHGLADGAIFCNNPTITCITEFYRLKKFESHKGITNSDELGCVISIGSGVEPVVPLEGGIDINLTNRISIGDFKNVFGRAKNLVTLFMYQCTSSHGVSNSQAREWAHSLNVPFFRFSPKLVKAYELDNISLESIFDFMFETEVYLRTQVRHDIRDLARLLKHMPKHQMQNYLQTIT